MGGNNRCVGALNVARMTVTLFASCLCLISFIQFSTGQPFADLECEVKKAALAFGAERTGTNLAALERGLNFADNCSHHLPAQDDTRPPSEHIPRMSASALRLFVSPSGDDHNPGTTPDKPFSTLAQARDAIRYHKRQQLASNSSSVWAGAVVNISDGKYFMKHPLHLSVEDSGSEDAPILYTASRPNGKVTLSGGTPLTLSWTKSKTNTNVFQAQVPEGMTFTTLFVNGVRQIRARYPNGDPQQMSGVCYYVSQEGDEGCQGYATASGAISEDARLDHLFKDRQGNTDFSVLALSNVPVCTCVTTMHLQLLCGRNYSDVLYKSMKACGGRRPLLFVSIVISILASWVQRIGFYYGSLITLWWV
eukprot:scpid85980/ scgid3785/ 